MTAASESLTCLASRGRARPTSGLRHLLRRWERVLVVLAVCLPVPVLAATGLSIPLPTTVERLAAALVPWGNAANLEADESPTVGADGAIVLAPHELAGIQAGAQATALADATGGRSRAATTVVTGSGKEGSAEGGGTGTGGGTDGTSSDPAGGGSGGGGSSDSSGAVQSVVNEAGPATQPVVDAVQDTVNDPAGTVGGIVEDAGQAAGGVLPVAGP
jgi:hypothetical protein